MVCMCIYVFPYTNSCQRLAVYIISRKRVLIGKHKPSSIDNNSFIPEKEKLHNNVCVSTCVYVPGQVVVSIAYSWTYNLCEVTLHNCKMNY